MRGTDKSQALAVVIIAILAVLSYGQVVQASPDQQSNTLLHIVKSGDTLSSIAQRYGSSIEAIVLANGLAIPNSVRAGMRLVIPVAAYAVVPMTEPSVGIFSVSQPSLLYPAGGCGRTYVVRPGDSLHAIARRCGIAFTDLIRANGLNHNSLVIVGQILTLPISGSPGAGLVAPMPQSTPVRPLSCGSLYIVTPGDNLTAIASRCGVELDELLRVNKLSIRSVIWPGQKLIIPRQPVPYSTPAAPSRPLIESLVPLGLPGSTPNSDNWRRSTPTPCIEPNPRP